MYYLGGELGVSDETFLIGTVGRFAPQKDHFNLVRALKLLQEKCEGFHAVFVGHGCDQNNLELVNFISDLGLNNYISLVGQRADIVNVMNGIDVHVTSSAFGEAFPNVICEAMACGTVCVTTDVGDAGEIVGSSGFVVPPTDSVSLSHAISESYSTMHNSSKDWIF